MQKLPTHFSQTQVEVFVPGGAAFVQAPGSYRAALEAGAALPEEVQARLTAKGCRTLLPELVGQGVPGSGVSECRAGRAREVTMAEGDL